MAIDMYLKIHGIQGECTDSKHPEWIEVNAFAHEVNQPVSGASGTGGRTGGRAEFNDFAITKIIDCATPELTIHCANGKHIPTIELELCLATGGKHTFMKYTMEDCIVSSVQHGGLLVGEARPAEVATFAYGKFKWEYTPIDHTGSAMATLSRSWSVESNKQI
jgi:type VI secretion system secreted protein Hcp